MTEEGRAGEIRARGYIIRTFRLSDTSLVVEWLTRERGRMDTVARGALRPRSALAGKLDLCFLARILVRRRRRSGLHLLREAQLESVPERIRRSWARLERLACGIALVRWATETDTPIPEIFDLFGRGVERLEGGAGPGWVPWFEWLLLEALGLQPRLEDCPGRAALPVLEEWSRSRDYLREPEPEAVRALGPWLGRAWRSHSGTVPAIRGRWYASMAG